MVARECAERGGVRERRESMMKRERIGLEKQRKTAAMLKKARDYRKGGESDREMRESMEKREIG